MKYKTPVLATILMSAMFPATQVYAHQGKAMHNNAQKNVRFAPELFDDFGVTQSVKKGSPVKSVKGKNRSVSIKMDLLNSDALTLTLFDDVIVTAIRDRLIDKVKGSTTWIGHIEDELDSEVFLTVRGKTMSGTVKIGEDLYEINLAGNQHKITKINPANNPDFADDIQLVDDYLLENEALSYSSYSEPQTANAEAGTIIDVMIVYTPKARSNASGQSGIEAKIINAVAKANQAYINSKVDMQINLVHMSEINYTETGNTSESLSAITNTSDGKMDEIHTMRNQYGADQVVLISTDTSACGTGYLMANPSASFAAYAFSVVHDDSKYSCLSNHTLAHELGHNQGNHHDEESAGGGSGAYAYSYGHRLCETGGFRTVMAYNCSGVGRVGQFSNPNVMYNGEYTGTSNADNARSMTNTKAIVASFRGSSVDVTTPNAPSNLSVSAISESEVGVNWADNANNEVGFRLERSADNVNWAEIATVGSNIRSFTDSGLFAGTTYQYRVRAYNGNGNSAFSNVASAVTKTRVVETCANNAPALTISANTQYSQPGASITYNISLANQDNSVCGVTTFILTTSEGATLGSYSLGAGGSTNTKWVSDAPLTDGRHTKSVTVSAAEHNKVSKSADIIVDGTAPTAPANLYAAVKRRSQVDLSWNASTDNGSGFDHYVIKRNGVTIATTSRTSYTDKLGSGTFVYTVDAFDKVGNAQGNSTSITVGGSSTSKKRGKKK